jgi:hypothetical protein
VILVGAVYAMVMRGRSVSPRPPEIPARPLQPGQPVSPSTIAK